MDRTSGTGTVLLGVCAALLLGAVGPGCAGRITIVGERINFYDKVRFETNKAILKPESHKLLNGIARVIQERPEIKRIKICGHTDNVGRRSVNQRLSKDRAEAVRHYLIQRGIAPNRLVAVGYGERKPIASNRTPAGREKNRRVEFVILR